MDMGEAASLVLGLFVPAVMIVVIIAIVSPYLDDPNTKLNTLFQDFCSDPDGTTIQMLERDEQTAVIQFMYESNFEFDLTYPRNTFMILSSAYDSTSGNLVEAVNSFQGLLSTRRASNFLRDCRETPCLCVVKTSAQTFSFSDMEYTACFPLLYKHYRTEYDTIINTLISANPERAERSIFIDAINALLGEISEAESLEAEKVRNCYNWFNTNSYTQEPKGVAGSYYWTIDSDSHDSLNTPLTARRVLTSFYEATNGGFFDNVMKCVPIPNRFQCTCPSSNLNNFLTHDGGILLGLTGSKRAVENNLDVPNWAFRLAYTPNFCGIEVYSLFI